jgi:hypothetical protein
LKLTARGSHFGADSHRSLRTHIARLKKAFIDRIHPPDFSKESADRKGLSVRADYEVMDTIEVTGNFPGRLAWITPLQGLALLVGGELRLAAHLHAAGLREPAALAGARADQLALKLGQAAQDGQHQAAVGPRELNWATPV